MLLLCSNTLAKTKNSSPVSRGAHTSLIVLATAYTDKDAGCNKTTATGSSTRTKTGAHIPGVAVDPRTIPLHSEISLDGGKTWIKADDTGGAIKGRKIDIRMDTRRDAFRWGRRTVTILVRKP